MIVYDMVISKQDMCEHSPFGEYHPVARASMDIVDCLKEEKRFWIVEAYSEGLTGKVIVRGVILNYQVPNSGRLTNEKRR